MKSKRFDSDIRNQGVEPFNFSGSGFGLGSTAVSNFGSAPVKVQIN